MNVDDLDARQRQVVKHIVRSDCRVFVEGGPGSGKTTTALWTARSYLDLPTTSKSSRVLFLTFSRSAVSEIAKRSLGILSGIENRVEISTFHGLAYRVISAFGRYDGIGIAPINVQSEARRKLLGNESNQITYDDMLPMADSLVSKWPLLSRLLAARWPLVICDEVQDTSGSQWNLLRLLNSRRVLLLGDIGQLIYKFLPGVTPERYEELKAWCDHVVELSGPSHRDPSGTIPALAGAVRLRRFSSEEALSAAQSGRLIVMEDR